ncbi:glycosyltransferase [Vibrio atypicus]|uniref:glycosyltransferase n=1 Tax=Vibrio atypicus TaxID=558271 RepID=UPI001CEC540B|nr:glycosyltransferase [Vibrio atypicus]
MEFLILAIARFRNDKKEAMSKNFVNLAHNLSLNGHPIITVSPTSFESNNMFEQCTFREKSTYESLREGVVNIIRMCDEINKLLKLHPESKINIHIATPIELLIVFVFLNSNYRKNTTLSIWQSFLTAQEVVSNKSFFARRLPQYLHLLLFNSFLSSPLYRIFLRYFKQVIVHSQFQKEQLSLLTNIPIHFVQNGVFSEKKTFPSLTSTLCSQASLLYIGHAKPSKGVDALIHIVATLKKRGILDFHLTLCLSGFGSQNEIDKLISDYGLESHISFKGSIDIEVEMSQADLLILPLRTCVGTSLTPNLVVEAFSCGLPIAIPEFEQLSGIIQYGINAIRLDLNNLNESAKEIEKIFQFEHLNHLSKNINEQFLDKYTLEKFVSGYTQNLVSQ